MQYAIYTRGKNVDYKWSSQKALPIVNYLNGNGIVVERQTNGLFSVYIVSEPTTGKDYQGRNISISVLVSDCPEQATRALSVWALEKWGNYAPDFIPCVRNFANDDWEADTVALEHFVEEVIKSGKSVEMTGIPFTNRIENGNTEASRKQLICEIKNYDFSANAGFKLVADGSLMTGEKLKELRYSLDRYLSGNGERKVLPNSETAKKQGNTPRQSAALTKFFTHAVCLLIGVVCCWGLVNQYSQEWWSPAKTALDNLEKKLISDADSKLSDRKQQIANQEKKWDENERKIEEQGTKINNNKTIFADQAEQKKEFTNEMNAIADRLPTQFRKLLTKIEDVGTLNDAKEKIEKRISELESKNENGQPNSGMHQQHPSQNESR